MAPEKQNNNKLAFVAHVISLALNPVNMITLIIVGFSIRFQIPFFMMLGILTPFILFMLVFFFYRIVVKRDSDLDLTKLEMRKYIGVSATAGFLISFWLAHQYFPFLDTMFLRAGIIIVISGLITLKWKISFHSIGYTSFCLTFYELFGLPWLISLVLLPIVFWSRLYLKRHTFGQLLMGSLLCLVVVI